MQGRQVRYLLLIRSVGVWVYWRTVGHIYIRVVHFGRELYIILHMCLCFTVKSRMLKSSCTLEENRENSFKKPKKNACKEQFKEKGSVVTSIKSDPNESASSETGTSNKTLVVGDKGT